MFSPTLLPHAVEDGGAAGEVDAGEIGMIEQRVRDRDRIARQEVDHARRQAGGLEQLASRSSALSIARAAGFQITVLPISAGAAARLPPIAVKLNGETA